MLNLNSRISFRLLILVLLWQGIRSDWDYVSEQSQTASRPHLEKTFAETLGETIITTAVTVDDEKFDDNELKKLFIRNFKFYKHSVRDGNTTEGPLTRPRRQPMDTGNYTAFGMECFTCYGNSSSQSGDGCYGGVSIPTKRCSDAEQCFIENNPEFIKRGCIPLGKVNRTFICKCPLCNDKPAYDISNYEYKEISDWEYDNSRLKTPLTGMDLMCKICETKGLNPASDKNCKLGKNVDYMVCGRNQLCYINVDDETDFVARGCITGPVYNSFYYFCNSTLCNSQKFHNPREKIKLRVEEVKLKEEPTIKKINKKTRSCSTMCTSDLYLVVVLAFMKCI